MHGGLLCDENVGEACLVDTRPAKARDAKLSKQGEQLQQLGDLRDGKFIQVEWRLLLVIEAKWDDELADGKAA
jgi:hypothetical protein